jgi:hypothetical protein
MIIHDATSLFDSVDLVPLSKASKVDHTPRPHRGAPARHPNRDEPLGLGGGIF